MRFLGIDTSCYTTSVAVYDSSKGLMGEERIVLSVKEGRRGLSQSEMVFQHVKNLPVLLRRLSPLLQDLKGIGVSGFPRRRADSYMPAFLVGRGMAEALSSFASHSSLCIQPSGKSCDGSDPRGACSLGEAILYDAYVRRHTGCALLSMAGRGDGDP